MRGGEGFLTENDLIKKCKKGSREAFNILVSNYQQQVINIAYGMLSNQEDAYDAAQEVFVRVYKSIESFKEQSSFTTWLYRITKNVCSDILRKRQKHSGVISINQAIDEKKDMDIRDESPTPEENMEISERQRAVREGLSYDYIAEVLGIPSGTVKSRINRARSALKKNLMNKRELF